MTLQAMWRRVPVIVRAIPAGLLVTAAVTVPWAILVAANLKYWPTIPWSAMVTAPLLWLYWQFLKRKGKNLRALPLSGDVWGMAIFAGMIGLGALLAFQSVLARLVPLGPEQELPDVSKMPSITLFALIVMGSVVAGFTEEAGFRGYMQGMIAQRHGPAIAVLVSGTVFGLMHFSHRNVGFGHLPFYIAVSAVFGMLAYLTGSIMPGVVLHTFGDIFEGVQAMATSGSTWSESAGRARTVWETGPDLTFWGLCAWATVWIVAAVLTYRGLANEVTAGTIAEVKRHG